MQHIRQEEELKLKALAAAQELRKLESKQIVLEAEMEVAEANVIVDAVSIVMKSWLTLLLFWKLETRLVLSC